MTSIGSLRGKSVLVHIPAIIQDGPRWYTLQDVEQGGLWLIGKDLSEHPDLAAVTRVQSDVPVFVPFAQISYVVGLAGPIPTEEQVAELKARAEKAAKPPRRTRAPRQPRTSQQPRAPGQTRTPRRRTPREGGDG